MITSTKNEQIKQVKSLLLQKTRVETGLFLVEGKRGVLDSLGLLSPKSIFVTNAFLDKHNKDLVGRLDTHCPTWDSRQLVLVDEKVMDHLCDTQKSQGIVAVFAKPVAREVSCSKVLYLDRVQDPGNMGSMIRSAAAFGFLDIVCNGCVDPYNPKVVRSAMSSFAYVNFAKVKTTAFGGDIVELKQQGYQILCADMQGIRYTDYLKEYKKRNKEKICLVVGNESNGIQQEILNQATSTLCIPMQCVESLNVAVAASILMAGFAEDQGCCSTTK